MQPVYFLSFYTLYGTLSTKSEDFQTNCNRYDLTFLCPVDKNRLLRGQKLRGSLRSYDSFEHFKQVAVTAVYDILGIICILLGIRGIELHHKIGVVGTVEALHAADCRR